MKLVLAAVILAFVATASSAPLADQVKITSLQDLIQAPNLTDLTVQEPCLIFTNLYCLAVWDPVCGSNGVTYSNNCTLSQNTCGDVTVAYKGVCGTIAK